MGIRPVVSSRSMQTDGQRVGRTYRKTNMTMLIASLRNFVNVPKNSSFYHFIEIFDYRLETLHLYQQIDSISKFWQHFSAVKRPSSAQNRTKSRYNEGVHCMRSHIIYNSWYIKNLMLADINKKVSD
jgi:hypothetical protein